MIQYALMGRLVTHTGKNEVRVLLHIMFGSQFHIDDRPTCERQNCNTLRREENIFMASRLQMNS